MAKVACEGFDWIVVNIFFVFLQSVFVAELLVANVTLEAKVFQVNDSDVAVEIAGGSKLLLTNLTFFQFLVNRCQVLIENASCFELGIADVALK
jgi:hypothetical protein